ncbi:hypothetical protein J4Q44_G00390070, partial [Coregonus suidteri]
MDQITFHYDTVLSDIHLLLPNSRHLMACLNRVGQPVFISRFRILWDGAKQDTCDLGSPCGGEELDRDTQEEKGRGDARGNGDLEVTRRQSLPRRDRDRDMVYPIILSQARREEEEEEEAEEECPRDVIRIEHTMATPLEDVGKQ